MSTIEDAIFTLLSTESTISDIVGTRIYPLFAEQDEPLPHIIFQQISGNRDHTYDGASGFTQSRYQFTCLATTYKGAKALFEAVRMFFDGFKGTVLGVEIQANLFSNEIDSLANLPGVDQVRRYGKILETEISFIEP